MSTLDVLRMIRKKLVDTAPVQVLVSGRVYPASQQPQPLASTPYITLQRVSSEHFHHMTGANSKLSQTLIQVSIIDKTQSGAITLASRVRSALDGSVGSVTQGGDSINVQMLSLTNEFDDMSTQSGELRLARVIQEYRISHDV